MITPGSANALLLDYTSGSYQISRSLRFRSSASAYLSRTPASAGNQQKWTWSGWVKRGAIGALRMITIVKTAGNNYSQIYFSSSDTIVCDFYNSATQVLNLQTTQVFRDPSAWYHLVLVLDTTSATSTITGTSTDRFRIYVNGAQITAFSTASPVPSQNTNCVYNSANQHVIGYSAYDAAYPFDGYLAEVNFIDGQALTPSSFGAFDTNGVWQPAKYTGSYGTNGFYLPFTPNTTSTYALYQPSIITDYIGFPTGSQGTNFTFSGDFTIEGWVYFTSASSGDNSFYVQSDGGGTNYLAFNISMTAGIYNIYLNSPSVSNTISHGLTANTWNHVAMVRSGSTITLYTNGVSKGTITNSATLGYSTLTVNRIGGGAGGARYTSNFRITKSAVYTSAFTPPTSPLAAVANTVILTCQNSTAVDNSGNSYSTSIVGSATLGVQYPFGGPNIVGNDASGASNNWTSNNISLATGTTYDSMIDSPTNYADGGNGRGNYPVLNPINGNSGTFSAANLQFVGPTNWSCVPSTILIPSTGKWFVAATFTGSASGNTSGGEYAYLGVAPPTVSKTAAYNSALGLWIGDTGWVYNFSATGSNSGSSFSVNNEVLFAVDRDANTYAIYKNGSSVATGTIGTTSGADLMFVYGSYSSSFGQMALNFGQRPFAYTPPSGFSALNTQNLPTPTIAAGNKYFDATTYTGTGSTQSVTNSGSFKPDLVWLKRRDTTGGHYLYDAVRGANIAIFSDSTSAETTYTTTLMSFDTSGFTLGTAGGSINASGGTFIGWNWNAGGSTVSGTGTGGITNVSYCANPTAGFSVVTYTGSGTAGTVTHGLGVAPSFIIVKNRDSSAQAWHCYHASLGNSAVVFLNSTAGQSTGSSDWWNNTSPTSSVFSVGVGGATNGNTQKIVAYCFSPVASYSSFGSFSGNSSSDGSYIYLGFKPKWLLIKGTGSGGSGWMLLDTSRDTYNVSSAVLRPDLSAAESTGYGGVVDILSNGFKLRSTDTNSNSSSTTYGPYIYAAFAEVPFKTARAR